MALCKIYGVGVDIAYIPRFVRTFDKFGDRFLQRAYHPEEVKEFYRKSAESRYVFLASRWAVKEATYKAFRQFRVQFPEIRVVRDKLRGDDSDDDTSSMAISHSTVAPRLVFSGETKALAAKLALAEPQVSLSHDGDYAIAHVIMEQEVKQSDGE
ncbi:TPA: hypothetical protein N0F65_004313 [Lagenidium giganteum]|uniref:4'-phosphopantetheinyl transferase domain-containing protein n=1 Tax=Lagenidium giganteum TaxID=4803 RepID=A0AAV2ZJR3_9STRA|nr:TPA: hypothetical protein N0F65_004313 [Lagenidium giganteum]